MNKMRIRTNLAAWSALAVMIVSMGLARTVEAKTPNDTLVVATNISDVIALDPAEVFEIFGGEVIANVYDRLMMYNPEDINTLSGGVAESYSVSEDGKTITFKLRSGMKFHSGNPVTAEDVAWSLRRVIKLNKTPSFILTQFGWDKDNVDELIRTTGPLTVALTNNSDFSSGMLLQALAAGVGSVVDRKLAMINEADGDFGYGWLKNNTAGSGPFFLKAWKANELITLEANPDYHKGEPAMKRVVFRHVPEPATQRLLVEKGDVDMARSLTTDQIKGLAGNADVVVKDYAKVPLIYIATNNSHPVLGKDKVRQAIRYLVDYDGMAESFLAGQYTVHQALWPLGLPGALDENPFQLDVAKGKALLSEAGVTRAQITLDTLNEPPFQQIAQSVQQTLSQAGIDSEIILSEGKTLWPKYRARKHEMIIAYWYPDYMDPHSNADAFANNPDNRDEAQLTGKPVWRTSWFNPEINAMTEKAAKEQDLEKRLNMYLELQRKFQMEAPFTMMFQETDQVAMRKEVKGFVSGVNFDQVYYRMVTK